MLFNSLEKLLLLKSNKPETVSLRSLEPHMAQLMSLRRSDPSTTAVSELLKLRTVFSEIHGPESSSPYTFPTDTARTQRPSLSRRAATSPFLRAQKSTVLLMAPWMSPANSELSMLLERETSVETTESGLTHGPVCQRPSLFHSDTAKRTRLSLSESMLPSLFHEHDF